MIRAFIGVGSNLGNPQVIVAQAARQLGAVAEIQLVAMSSLYVSAPWGGVEQADFINSVVEINTALAPAALMQVLLDLERLAGRVRGGTRWGPRALDLDVLLYGDRIISEAGLSVPHPHLAERAFVLMPLAEIAPSVDVPGHGNVLDLLSRIDVSSCRRLAS